MYEMSQEISVLLHLLRRNLRPQTDLLSEAEIKGVDWNAVMEEAAYQAVLIPAFDAAAPYKKLIPIEVYQRWFQRVSRGLASNICVSRTQRALTALLESKEYPYIILKGEASASYYQKSELRQLGDVDFLINPKQQREIEELLVAAGYVKVKDTVIQHVEFRKDGVCLELHFSLPGFPEGSISQQVRNYMNTLFAQKKRIGSPGKEFYVPEEAHHGLILLLHMQNHMVEQGLGLRHLCDWAAFVEYTWQQSFWQEKLLPLLKKIGLYKYAAVMTQICADVFGTSCFDWDIDKDPELCNAVLQDILIGGNFGRKDPVRSKAGLMVPKQRNDGNAKGRMYGLWKTVHRSTYNAYPIVRKIKIFHPVFDAYRIGLYLCRVVSGRRPSLAELIPLAESRTVVYQQLHIFEVEECALSDKTEG